MAERLYEVWEDPGTGSFVLGTAEKIADQQARGLLSAQARRLFQIPANTFEEASAIFNLRMGWGPYKPEGEPAQCPNCGAWYYPRGSGECWRCGKVG